MGSGGREHALAWKLSSEAEVFAAPGNPGVAQIGECFPINPNDTAAIRSLCGSLRPDLVLVGPEDPLIGGLADALRADGFNVFGPGAKGARLEGSKAFSKELMMRAGVPTADYRSCSTVEKASSFAREVFAAGRSVVVKASGAALGKGVIVCSALEEAEEAIRAMLEEKAFGDAGSTIVVEERLKGPEFSLLVVASGRNFVSLPIAQDYKRALDNDRGPNTGGMGSYSPVSWLDPGLCALAEEMVAKRALHRLADDGIDFRGVLFCGVLVQNGRPYCLEYNVRFGDPETQTVVRRLGAGLPDLLMAAARGDELPSIAVKDNAAVSVVLASGGYPGVYQKGLTISLPSNLPQGVQIFHAGTRRVQGQLVTAGGRVLCVSASAPNLPEARKTAYKVCDGIKFEGMHYRSDIASVPVAAI